MHRRPRLLIGTVLLVSTGLSLAETVWASTCSPLMAGSSAMALMALMEGMDGTDGMTGMKDMPRGARMPEDHDCMPGHAHELPKGSDDDMPCPFSPAGAGQGCAASVSLPASVATVASLFLDDVIVPPSGETTPHLLRTASIFHPPKA